MQSSDEMTTLSVNLSGVPQSRATTDPTVGKGLKVNKLYYAVYQDGEHVYPAGKNGVADIVDFKANVNLPILKGETYDIVFWAQAGSTTVYNISDLREIRVNYQNAYSNKDEYDAFYNALKNFKADGNNHPLELRRPFAQLNLGTSYKESNDEAVMGDWQKAFLALKNKDIPPVTHSSVKVDGLADTFAPLDGKASGDVERTFQSAEIIGQTFNIGDNKYYNLSLNYLLVPGEKAPQGLKPYTAISSDDKALVDVTYTLYRGEGNELFTMNKISSVPVKRNHRTNIVGELLTSTEYDININPEGDVSDTNKEIRNIKFLALASEMASHTSEDPVIYNVSGLSTTDGVVIEIPDAFNAKQATFNFTDIKDGTTLEIKDASGSTYTGSIYVNLPTTEGHNLTSTVVNLPGAHAELLVGNFGAATVTTSQTTLVVGEGAKVTTLTVQGGNVEIQTGGDVDEIKVDENAGIIIVALGDDVEVPEGVEDNKQIILAGTDDAKSTEETVYVAQVGEYKFTDLNDAVAAIAEVGEVKMIGNCVVTSTVTIPAGKTITLELNGMTISQSYAQTGGYEMIMNNGNLIVQDSKGGGKISYTDTGMGGNYVSNTITNRGILTVKGGTIENNSSEAMANVGYAYAIDTSIWGDASETIVNIEGGEIKSIYSPLRVRADSDTEKVEANISGGTLYGRIDHQMSSSKAGVIGILNISGGTFKPFGIKADDVLMIFGAGLETDASGIVANISGGTFEGGILIHRGEYVPLGQGFNENFISGGTFKTDISSYVADGYKAVQNNGVWTITQLNMMSFSEFNQALYDKNGMFEAAVEDELIVVLKDSEKSYYNNKTCQYFLAGNGNVGAPSSIVENITVKNVTFKFVDDDATNNYTSGELQVFSHNMTFENCTFIGTAVSPWGKNNNVIPESAVIKNCVFQDLSGRYGIHQNRAKNLEVIGCTFTNCERGIHTNSSTPELITITCNTFTGIGAEYGMLCLAENGDYTQATLNITNNTAEGQVCLRQLNNTVTYEQVSNIFEHNTYGTKFVAGSKDPSPVAAIGDKTYKSLQEAFNEVQNDEIIKLLGDVQQADGIVITDKNITIDLNQKTFTVSEGASTNNRNFKIIGSSVVTIKNGTMVAAGDYSSGAYGTIRTEGTANVTLEGVKLYNYRGNGLNVKALSGTTVTINNTEIYANYGGGVEAAGGNIELSNVIIEQKGMYTSPWNSMTISVNGGGKAIVHSGTYTTECITAEEANNQGSSHGPWTAGVLNSGGTLIIKGGTFSNDNFGENSLATTARGLLLADTGANIQIEGGNFNALKSIIDIQNNLGDASKNPSVTLSGGIFSANPETYEGLINVAEGYEAKQNEDGTYTVSKSSEAEE